MLPDHVSSSCASMSMSAALALLEAPGLNDVVAMKSWMCSRPGTSASRHDHGSPTSTMAPLHAASIAVRSTNRLIGVHSAFLLCSLCGLLQNWTEDLLASASRVCIHNINLPNSNGLPSWLQRHAEGELGTTFEDYCTIIYIIWSDPDFSTVIQSRRSCRLTMSVSIEVASRAGGLF